MQMTNINIQAILFDLDGTLLGNDMVNGFLPHYFQALGARLAHLVPPQHLIASILAASEAMSANEGPLTNAEVFAADFYPRVRVERTQLEPHLEAFYIEDFPQLHHYTQRKPAARQAVQTAFDLGYTVVIATNPLFPAAAVQQRLLWADVADFDYRHITTYENSRAAKPNLRYYADICNGIGIPPEACLMVGDEAMDLVAAHLGCRTFLIPSPTTTLTEDIPAPTYQGTLEDLCTLLPTLSRTPSN